MASFFANCISNVAAVASHLPDVFRHLSSHNMNILSRTVSRTLASQATEMAKTTNAMQSQENQSEQNLSQWPAWKPGSKRTGLIGIKLGMMPMWMKNGTRVPVTLIRVSLFHILDVAIVDECNRLMYHSPPCSVADHVSGIYATKTTMERLNPTGYNCYTTDQTHFDRHF